MSQREALLRVIELLAAAAETAHRAELVQVALLIESTLLDAQRAYRRRYEVVSDDQ
ncbi:hypothetical protein NET02_12685 [Thermomicrobiaceae bacterium CFH 74404]|uniref:Uncharacterized protein n=1 Tax=Thermalbibacter longus TaxID=2951981 RepID=A0AA41WIJ6_9BACT|nr:hypothetical protein [Thermalbibacter longus]MCM8750006.1 hypothetical protein [Thermalbibacter longus]